MELNVDETLRYLGVDGQTTESVRTSVTTVTDKLTVAVQPRYTYRMCSLQKTEAGFLLPEAELVLPGTDATKVLKQYNQAVLMACTLGTQFEALLRREQAHDMSRAVILAAYDSTWVEAGCDQAEQGLVRCLPNRYRTDRLGSGYGDLPLSLQPKICVTLDTQRRLGLCVTESYLMSLSKSVIAIIGLSGWSQMAHICGCAYYPTYETCKLRVRGKRCGS